MKFANSAFTIPAHAPPMPLDRALREHFPDASWSRIRKLIETGKVQVNKRIETNSRRPIREGDVLSIHMAAPRVVHQPRLGPESIVYADAQVIVVLKPSGMLSIPFEAERGTCVDLVKRMLEKRTHRRVAPLGIVHRIDRETSGLLVFTRTAHAKRSLEQQFRAHTVRRTYRALVHGTVATQTFRSRLIADRGDGLRGAVRNPNLGQIAITHVRALESLRRATFIECKLDTGRTHQIRIQLAEAGHPLLGEHVYIRGYEPEPLRAPRLMLHALSLGFEHPTTGAPLEFSSELPEDMGAVLNQLR